MKITLVVMGKTDQDYLKKGIEEYIQRLKHYTRFEIKELPSLKKTGNLPPDVIKQKEAEVFASQLAKADAIILLDERGKQYSSVDFSAFLQKQMNAGIRELAFVVGGAWGFDEALKKRAHNSISLSKMTFSHQMVRLFFAEQLYRAFTILKGEGYHNQ